MDYSCLLNTTGKRKGCQRAIKNPALRLRSVTGLFFKSNKSYSNNALSTSPLNSIVFITPESVISPIT